MIHSTPSYENFPNWYEFFFLLLEEFFILDDKKIELTIKLIFDILFTTIVILFGRFK